MRGLAAGQFRRSAPARRAARDFTFASPRGRRAASPSHFLRRRRPILRGHAARRGQTRQKGTAMAIRRFPLLGKTAALAGVVIALSLALQTVSGIVAEREGRLREAERSVAASLASAQTLVGPVIERDCSESVGGDPGRGQGQEDRHRAAPLQAERDAGDARRQGRRRHRAALPRHLQGQRLRAEGAPGRGLERRRDAGAEAQHPGSRLHCDAPVMFVALGDSRGVRSAAMQIDGAVVPVLAGTRHARASARLPRRRRRVVRRRAPAAARRDRRSSSSAPASSRSRRSATAPAWRSRPTGRTRRSPAASCRSSARSARPASRRAGSSTRWRRPRRRPRRAARRRAASTTASSTRSRRARRAGARPASRPSASPSWTRSARTC